MEGIKYQDISSESKKKRMLFRFWVYFGQSKSANVSILITLLPNSGHSCCFSVEIRIFKFSIYRQKNIYILRWKFKYLCLTTKITRMSRVKYQCYQSVRALLILSYLKFYLVWISRIRAISFSFSKNSDDIPISIRNILMLDTLLLSNFFTQVKIIL